LEQGTRTGIKRRGLTDPLGVTFEGRQGTIVRYAERFDASRSLDLLVLGFGDSYLALYGYFSGDAEFGDNVFMEVDREIVDP